MGKKITATEELHCFGVLSRMFSKIYSERRNKKHYSKYQEALQYNSVAIQETVQLSSNKTVHYSGLTASFPLKFKFSNLYG